jgi:FlaA1/EpsC-like NDP-sugar epimerase
MLEVNLIKADYFLATLRQQGHGLDGVFFVSTDKAACPVSLMGASKRVMELLLWVHAQSGSPLSLLQAGAAAALPRVTCARFANVAFSDGSLPWAFLQRMEKRQPLAAPGDVRRYLISPADAGQLCLLATVLCPPQELLIPKLGPEDMVQFTGIAEKTLNAFGLTPAWFDDAQAACRALPAELAAGRYPVLVTKADTDGEKEAEEFVAAGESAHEVGLQGALAVPAPAVDAAAVASLLQVVGRALATCELPTKRELVQALAVLAPDFQHRDSGASLDTRM